ncbi:MAG: AAA family ATPase [Hyphomonadaceae bacterium]|nr:AAA family ATPase [Hyphomonadaceae bacterium]
MSENKFKRLQLARWRQFKEIDVEFSSGVTILTGRNGTGKTSLLNILAQHTSFKPSFVAAPHDERTYQKRDSLGRYSSGYWEWYEVSNKFTKVGSIDYDDGQAVDIMLPTDVGRRVNLTFSGIVSVPTLYIPSHRHFPSSKPVEFIPTDPINSISALRSFQVEYWKQQRGEYTAENPLLKMKQAIISMAAFGPGNNRIVGDPESYGVLLEFEGRLREIIPKSIGFNRLRVNIPDVILETDTGSFLLDAASGGLMSLMSITWEITLFGRGQRSFVVLIDEPENHLHPSMQREFLPAMVRAFPEAQFIIATHSPFVVSSVKESSIYAFDVEDASSSGAASEDLSVVRNAVVAIKLEPRDRIRASEVLRQVLGVPLSTPIWVEEELRQAIAEFRDGDFTVDQLKALKQNLEERGLGDFLPDVVIRAAERDA